MPKLFTSLRARLIIFVLLASLPALFLTLYTGLEQRKQAAAAAQENAMRLVRLAANNQQLLIENTRGFLIALSHSLGRADDPFERCSNMFAHMLDLHFPYYSAFYVADLNANILCSMPTGDKPENLSECEHYQKLRASEDFVVSEYHICRNSGKATIAMGYPLRNANDERIGVINIGLDLAWFNHLATLAQLPSGAHMIVVDRSGTIMVHYPESDKWVGNLMPEGSVVNTILEQGEGTTEGLGTDDVERLFAFMPLQGTEESVFIAIGIPAKVAYAETEATLIRNLALLGLVTLLAVGAAWLLGDILIVHQARALVETTRQLAAGDLSARTTVSHDAGELGQLAQAFDQMAEALAQREVERIQAQQAVETYAADLERSNRDLQDFAYIASHDLQEPLRKIQTFSELMRTRYADQLDNRGLDTLERMREAAHRLQTLIADLLTYSRITSRGEPFSQVDLKVIARQVVSDLDVQIQQSGAQVEIDSLPVIEADPTQIYRLLQNLCSNALKFQVPGRIPRIKISGHLEPPKTSENRYGLSDGAMCEVQVQDNGIGFEEKYAERIFQPFERLHARDSYAGTGMGLAICRKIVERHGGTITVNSRPGEGSTFIFTLPITQANGDHAHEDQTD